MNQSRLWFNWYHIHANKAAEDHSLHTFCPTIPHTAAKWHVAFVCPDWSMATKKKETSWTFLAFSLLYSNYFLSSYSCPIDVHRFVPILYQLGLKPATSFSMLHDKDLAISRPRETSPRRSKTTLRLPSPFSAIVWRDDFWGHASANISAQLTGDHSQFQQKPLQGNRLCRRSSSGFVLLPRDVANHLNMQHPKQNWSSCYSGRRNCVLEHPAFLSRSGRCRRRTNNHC